jgi:hypothetical protein
MTDHPLYGWECPRCKTIHAPWVMWCDAVKPTAQSTNLPDQPRVWNKRDRNVPRDAVYVGRPTKWGNPYAIGPHGTRAQVIERYRRWLLSRLDLDPKELRGKHLVCWCAPLPCHADVLLETANA